MVLVSISVYLFQNSLPLKCHNNKNSFIYTEVAQNRNKCKGKGLHLLLFYIIQQALREIYTLKLYPRGFSLLFRDTHVNLQNNSSGPNRSSGARKPRGLNRRTNINYDYLCLLFYMCSCIDLVFCILNSCTLIEHKWKILILWMCGLQFTDR